MEWKKLRIGLGVLFVVAAFAVFSFFTVSGQDAGTTENTDFTETFESDIFDSGWISKVLIGNPNGTFLSQNRKRLSFTLPPSEAFVQLTNPDVSFSDVLVEATFENLRSAQATAAIMCRVTDDGWYELRIGLSGTDAGSYKLMKYDAYLKSQYKNPYVLIHPGMDQFMTPDILIGPNKKNTLGLECKGEEFRIFINGKEQFPVKIGNLKDDMFTEGSVGFSVQSYGNGLVDVDVTKFSAKAP